MKIRYSCIAALMCATTILHAEFKAGFSRVDATPPLGIPMLGYFNHRKAKGVLDPLYIECVAVSDGKNAALIYSVDDVHLIGPFLEKAFPEITAATGVPRDRIFIHSTHTHTGPACAPRWYFTKEQNRITNIYAEMRRTRLVDAGKMALADLKPSSMAIARTECKNISFIRRYRMKDGSVRTNPGVGNPDIDHPLAQPDESVQLIRFKREGAPDIAIVNFGTHTDTVGGEFLSADWPGVFRQTFESGIGGGVKCLFLNGAQGDANHVNVHPTPGRKKLPRKQIRKYIGRALAGAAMSVWDICEDVPTGKVGGMVKSITLPANIPTADEIKWVKMFDEGRAKEIPLKGMELKTITSKGSRVRKLMNGPKEITILVSNVSIGDSVAFSGLPCEPFVSIGTDIKKQSPFRMTVVTSLTNGSEGYIPSSSAHKDGGYEALSTRFAAATGDLLVATQLKHLAQLKLDAGVKEKK